MVVLARCLASPVVSPHAANDLRQRRRKSVVGSLTLALGYAICAPAVLAQSTPALAGTWRLSCTGRKGEARQVSIAIEQQGSTLSGSYEGERRSGKLNGSVQGNRVSFELAGKHRSVRFTGTMDGNSLQVHTAKGGVSCKATRQ